MDIEPMPSLIFPQNQVPIVVPPKLKKSLNRKEGGCETKGRFIRRWRLKMNGKGRGKTRKKETVLCGSSQETHEEREKK